MAWKCNTCGMPNFDDDVCKLCGAPKPENPEEFVEETETKAPAETPELVVAPAEDSATIEVPAEEPAEEVEIAKDPAEETVAEETMVEIPAEEAPEEEEAAEAPTEEPEIAKDPAEAPEPEPVPVAIPAEKPVAEPVPEKKKGKKGAVIATILVIILALLGAAAAYMYVTKNETEETAVGETVTTVAPSPEVVPEEEPEPEAEVSAVPSADPLDEIVDETVPGKTTTTPKPSSAPVQKTEGKAPAKPAAKPAAVTTPKPETSSKPTSNASLNDAYAKYVSKEFGFYCAYPKNFSVVDTGHANDALLNLTSPDKSANMIIQGVKNWEKLSAEEALERYIGLFDGKVNYRDYGNTWYAASVTVGDRVYYRKAFVKGGNIYCFSFEYNQKDRAVYVPYIEYIEDHFKRN